MTWAIVIGAIATLLSNQAPLVSADGDPWIETGGGAQASRVLATCLAKSSSGPRHANFSCIDEPFDECEDQHGQSQIALNGCTAFALAAWRNRLETQVHRTRVAAGRHAATFDSAQRTWRNWNKQDCDFQVPRTATGSMVGELRADCALTHIALRALELEALADDWEAHRTD